MPAEWPGQCHFDFAIRVHPGVQSLSSPRCPLGPKPPSCGGRKTRRNNHQHVGRKAFAHPLKQPYTVLRTSKLGT